MEEQILKVLERFNEQPGTYPCYNLAARVLSQELEVPLQAVNIANTRVTLGITKLITKTKKAPKNKEVLTKKENTKNV